MKTIFKLLIILVIATAIVGVAMWYFKVSLVDIRSWFDAQIVQISELLSQNRTI